MKSFLRSLTTKSVHQDETEGQKKTKRTLFKSASLPTTPTTSLNSANNYDALNQSFTHKPQLKKLSSIQENKPKSNKVNQKILNRVLQPLDNFPLHGLKFSGKDDSEEETIYKKELREIKEIEINPQSFKESLVFKLSGISEILRNPQLTPENTQTQRQETRTPRKSVANGRMTSQPPENKSNLFFIVELAKQRYSKKVIDCLNNINDAKTKQEVDDILKKDKDIQRLLKSFNEKNNNETKNHSPLVFFKYALSAELLIIAKQLYVLEKTNPTIKIRNINDKDSHIKQNADLLFSESNDAKEKMIRFIERKCQFLEEQNDLNNPNPVKGLKKSSEDTKLQSPPMQKIYENKLKAAVNSSCLQYKTLYDDGKLPIYLKDPTTRSFRSKNGISLPHGVTVSEDQYNILHEIDGAISKQHGTKIYARLPTGAGKSHLEKLMNEMFLKVNDNENLYEELTPLNKVSPAPHNNKKISPVPEKNRTKPRSSLSPTPNNNTPQSKIPANPEAENIKTAPIQNLININLNIFTEELQKINETADLKRNIVIADEAFFFSRLFLEGKIDYNIDSHINKSDIEQIEKFKDDFIKNLQNKGAIVLVMGASESLDKINHEIKRIEAKIFKEEAKIVAQSSSKLIKEANTYFYSNKDNNTKREKEPIYQKVIDENVGGKNLKEQTVVVTDRSQKGILGNDPTKAEFVIRTAFYIKQLSQFLPPELQELEEVKNVIDSLTPKATGAKSAQSRPNLNLTETLLGSGIFNADKITNASALKSNLKADYKKLLPKGGVSIETSKLKTAVDAFFAKKLDDNSFLYDQLPKDQQQERASDGSKLGNLKEKLKVRQYQYRDLEYRRDKLTKDRFNRSEIVATQSSNLESLEEKKPEESTLFEIIKDNLPQLKVGQKMQYILPDFNINDTTCGEEGLRELKVYADIIIIPHFNEEEKKLKCKIAYYSENDLFGLKECEIDNLDYEISEAKKAISLPEKQKPSIISFFDIKNAIGGDYKSASVNISKQYIQLTKEDCFSNENDFLTWNHLMQFNRDRTDLDSVDFNKLELKFILPESSITKDENDDISDTKEIIKNLLDGNTKKHDEIVLEGYKMYKGITRDSKLYVNYKRGSNSSLAIDLNDVSNFDQSFLKKDLGNGETEENNSILLGDEVSNKGLDPNDIFSQYQSQQTTTEENFISDGEEESIVEFDEDETPPLDPQEQNNINKDFYSDKDSDSDENEEEKDVKNSSEIIQKTEEEITNPYKTQVGENLGSAFDEEVDEQVKQKNQEESDRLDTIEEDDESSNSEDKTKLSQSNSSLNSSNQTPKPSQFEEFNQEDSEEDSQTNQGDDTTINLDDSSDFGLLSDNEISPSSSLVVEDDISEEEFRNQLELKEVQQRKEESRGDIRNSVSGIRSESRTSMSSGSSVKLDLSSLPQGSPLGSTLPNSPTKKTPPNSPEDKNEMSIEISHYKDEEKPTTLTPSPVRNSYKIIEGSFETPSPSPINPELSFNFYEHIKEQEDLISHQMTVNETKYREKAAGQEQEALVTLKKLYESEEKEGEKILNNIFYMMIKSAFEVNLNPKQALRALEIAKERKGIANGSNPNNLPDDFYSKKDKDLFEKYVEFEEWFQEYCYDCGIFSFLEELQGLRLCNIPKDSDEQFFDFVNTLQPNHENLSDEEEHEESEFSAEIIQYSNNAYNETIRKFKEISNQRRTEVEAEEKNNNNYLGR